MHKIKLTIEYDGKDLCGWQKQLNGVSVQELLENAFYEITKERVNIIGSGRTDAGAHSLGQVAHMETNTCIPLDKLVLALNTKLIESIRVIKAEQVSDDFHARFNAKRKTYCYKLYYGNVLSPLKRHTHAFVLGNLDYDKIVCASKAFIGTMDYKAFMASGSSVENTVRTIYSIDIKKYDNELHFYITGNGFLYKMVRNIVGTLVYTGLNKISVEQVNNIILGQDRIKAGITMPAHGLYLYSVEYD